MSNNLDLNALDLGTLRTFVGYSREPAVKHIERLLLGSADADDRDYLATFAASEHWHAHYPRTCEALARVLERK